MTPEQMARIENYVAASWPVDSDDVEALLAQVVTLQQEIARLTARAEQDTEPPHPNSIAALKARADKAEREREAYKAEALAASCTTAGTSLTAQLQQAEADNARLLAELATLEKSSPLLDLRAGLYSALGGVAGSDVELIELVRRCVEEAARLRAALEHATARLKRGNPAFAESIIDAALSPTPPTADPEAE